VLEDGDLDGGTISSLASKVARVFTGALLDSEEREGEEEELAEELEADLAEPEAVRAEGVDVCAAVVTGVGVAKTEGEGACGVAPAEPLALEEDPATTLSCELLAKSAPLLGV